MSAPAERRVRPGEPWVAVHLAGAENINDEALMAEARQITHDRLIEQLGDRRRSRVAWVWYDARGGLEKLREFDGDGQHDALCDYLREHPGGALVIAMADAIPTLRDLAR